MTRLLSLLFLLLFCFNTISQTKEQALRDAKKTSKATLESDFTGQTHLRKFDL